MKILFASLIVVLFVVVACNTTLLVQTDGPYIGENGISVPVPPPSLSAAPIQLVDIVGTLEIGAPQPKTAVYLYEGTSERGYFVYATEVGDFTFTSIELDLTNNCLEVWYEEPSVEARESEHSFFTAKIGADDQSVVVDQLMGGC